MGSDPSGGEPQPAEERSKIHLPVCRESREGGSALTLGGWKVAKKQNKNKTQKQKEEEKNK